MVSGALVASGAGFSRGNRRSASDASRSHGGRCSRRRPSGTRPRPDRPGLALSAGTDQDRCTGWAGTLPLPVLTILAAVALVAYLGHRAPGPAAALGAGVAEPYLIQGNTRADLREYRCFYAVRLSMTRIRRMTLCQARNPAEGLLVRTMPTRTGAPFTHLRL